MDCEILINNVNRRGTEMLEAMMTASQQAGIKCKISQYYTATTKILMSYGLGHKERRYSTDAHVRRGGKLIGWDFGYWNRDNKMRLTINADHPWKLIKNMPDYRFNADPVTLIDTYNPYGHILLIGMGRKSRAQFYYRGQQWELETLEKIRKVYPNKTIFYKPKKAENFIIDQVIGSIDEALINCSLVVCRHSNVAIDACLHNIPCVCWDGAGYYLYNDNLSNPLHPGYKQRLQFLQNLAWWQYLPSEAGLAWEFIKGILNEN